MYKLFKSVKDEVLDPFEGTISGELPNWINGTLYRNGPGLFEVGQTKYFHWFDGMAVLQSFTIGDGKVTYTRRFLQSETYKTNMAANRIAVSEFGTRAYPDLKQNSLMRLISKFTEEERTDNCPVSIVKIGQDLFASSETNFLYRFDPVTLKTLERVNISDIVSVNQASAKVMYDQNGLLHNVGYSYGVGAPKYCFFTLDSRRPREKVSKYTGKLVFSLDVDKTFQPSYIHSFSMTENYYIFVEQPLVINVWKVASAEVRKLNMFECLDWEKDSRVRFHIIDKRSGKEVNSQLSYEAMPFMVVNHGNAFELDDHIVMDLCVFRDKEVLDKYFMTNLAFDVPGATSEGDFPPSTYRRFIVPLKVDKNTNVGSNLVSLDSAANDPSRPLAILTSKSTISLTSETLCETSFELPVINPRFCGKRYQYVYGVTFHNVPKFASSLIKLNVNQKSSIQWGEENCFPSEPIFVPTPTSLCEDDGILLAAVNTTDDDKKCFLVMLNASNMKEVCRVTFPVWIPRDLHGIFVSKERSQNI